MYKFFKLVIIYFLWSSTAGAQPGTLDQTFADQGVARYHDVTYRTEIRTILQHSDGSIVTIGERRNGFGVQLQMLGYTENGAVNNNFGSNNLTGIPTWGYPGIVNTDIPSIEWESAHCATLQSDGKILVGGNAGLLQSGALIVRYLSDGSIDPSFNNGGFVYLEQGNLVNVEAMHVFSSGKILIAGVMDQLMGLSMFQSDGTVDQGFGNNGLLTMGAKRVSKVDMALDEKGRIVLSGSQEDGTNFSIIVARVLQDGSLDVSFGSGGMMQIAVGGQALQGAHISVQKDDQIIIAAEEKVPFTNPGKLFLARISESGTFDPTFGLGGKITHVRGQTITAQDMILQPDGMIIVTGRYVEDNIADLFVAKLRPDGSFDNAFGNDGLARSGLGLDLSSNHAAGLAVSLHPSGKILAGGRLKDAGLDKTILVRFNNEVGGGVTTALEDAFYFDKNLEVFPNPFAHQFTIKWSGLSSASYQILTVSGQQIAGGSFPTGSEKTIPVESQAPQGLILKLQSAKGSTHRKLIRN